MNKVFDKPIVIQMKDEATEKWVDVFRVHACINKTKTDNEYVDAGATRAKRSLTFEVRYFKELEKISYNTQKYQIIFQGVPFNIIDYDDFFMSHKTVKLLTESY